MQKKKKIERCNADITVENGCLHLLDSSHPTMDWKESKREREECKKEIKDFAYALLTFCIN